MLSPLLFIGLGGSGDKTLRAVKQSINRKLESVGYFEGIPSAWQFLSIDLTQDGHSFPAPSLFHNERLNLVPRGSSHNTFRERILNKLPTSVRAEALAGWAHEFSPMDLYEIPPIPYFSRSFMREVGLAGSEEILKALKNSIAKLIAAESISELREVSKLLKTDQNISMPPQVFIICSLIGFTGTGLFLDVAELLKQASNEGWVHDATGILYSPEVFESIPTAERHWTSNELGFLNEIIAGQQMGLSEITKTTYRAIGLLPTIHEERFGANRYWIIGSRNQYMDSSPHLNSYGFDHAFMNVGYFLGEVLTDPQSSNFLHRWISGPGRQGIDLSGLFSNKNQQFQRGFTGIGFAKLSVGTDNIVDYVADALTARQVEVLLWPRYEPLTDKNPSLLIQNRVDEIYTEIIRPSGMCEVIHKFCAIANALSPHNWLRNNTQWVEKLVHESFDDNNTSLEKFVSSVCHRWEEKWQESSESLESEIARMAETWVCKIQDYLRNQIAKCIAQAGYSVAISLLHRLQIDLRDRCLQGQDEQVKELPIKLDCLDKIALLSVLGTNAESLNSINSKNEQLTAKVKSYLFEVFTLYSNSLVTLRISSLHEEIPKMFIDPILKLLEEKRVDLMFQMENHSLPDGTVNRFQTFPGWGSKKAPTLYGPRYLESSLIETSEFERIFEMYVGVDLGARPAFPLAIGSSLLGSIEDYRRLDPWEENVQSLINVEIPGGSKTLVTPGQKCDWSIAANWTIQTGLLDLVERNKRWLRNPQTSFGRFTNISIRDFVEDPNVEIVEREERKLKFLTAFARSLNYSFPLIKLNHEARSHLASGHTLTSFNTDVPRPYVPEIPFNKDSHVGKACVSALVQNGIRDPELFGTRFSDKSQTSCLYFIRGSANSFPYWAIESLTKPVLLQVEQSNYDRQAWSQYWHGRRARPLVEAIPLEPQIRKSIITGWFISGLFGLSRIHYQSDRRSVSIWNPFLEAPNWSLFPDPLLPAHQEDMKRESWVLPQILTSLGLAFANFGKTGQKSYLHGYLLLKYLGREVTTVIPDRDVWDNHGLGDQLPTGVTAKSNVLDSWIKSGIKPAPEFPLIRSLESKSSSESERRKALILAMEDLKNHYASIWASYEGVSLHSLPETWELRHDIDLALNDILKYVMDLNSRNTDTSI